MKLYKKVAIAVISLSVLIADVKIMSNSTPVVKNQPIITVRKQAAKTVIIEDNANELNLDENILEENTELSEEDTVANSNNSIEQIKVQQAESTEQSTNESDKLNTQEQIAEQSQNTIEENTVQSVQEQPQETQELPLATSSSNVVEVAMQYLGYPYVSGGASPSGFDCSGFTQYVFGQCGISLNRTAADQANNGTPISKEELQPGDLLLFHYYGSSSIGHSGIYVGNGQFIHAANSNRGVVIDTIESGYYYDNYVGARRVQ